MKKVFFLVMATCIAGMCYGQNILKLVVRDSQTREVLPGVSILVKSRNTGNTSNAGGVAVVGNLPDGLQVVIFTHTGYEQRIDSFHLPMHSIDTIQILLTPEEKELEEVIVQSTRTSRTIANTPTRVETIDKEELDEKNNMRSANVSMLLHESTGLQVQQTSAVSGSASIRVQGLDGRYTQLLKDGYPNFGNFASGLSILEIPPLDLQQVEIIKGPASTLYGGGAIAGVVNFISKTPKTTPEYNLIFNQSNIGQTNAGIYAAHKKGKFGYSVLGSANFQKAYDVDNDDFSELPKSKNFTINPKLFYYPDSITIITLGNSFNKGTNTGGDMHVIAGNPDNNHVYFEKNNTVRNTTTLEFDKKYQNKNRLVFKQSLSFFDRKITIPNYVFWGLSTNSFSDLSYSLHHRNHTVIAGVNAVFDKFKQKEQTGTINQNTQSVTAGVYLQDTWDITNRIKIESGIRLDNANYKNVNYNKHQLFALPRVSALFKITNKISSRIGGGLGYKLPTIFTEQTETYQYKDVLALNNVIAERSIGGTADLNYRTRISDPLQFSINQMFFYTQINKPLVLHDDFAGNYFFANTIEPVQTKGFETNVKLVYEDDLKFFMGYTFTDAKAGYLTGNQYLPLLPKNKLNMALVYEKETNFKIGLEGYFTDKQFLYNGLQTPSFWEFGIMGEKTFHKIALFVNFENVTDQRQSKYKRVVNPPDNNPTFDYIWNHQEGFFVNGGFKIKL